ncbi:MAG: ADP-ribosylglycohydrolase family protein [Pirellulaceae bacterium]
MNESQCVGCIVGLAVGDALGFPAEFRRRDQILTDLGPDGITDFVAFHDPRFTRPQFAGRGHPPGTYTDDTQMTVAVAESLLESGRDDLDQLMSTLAKWFMYWSRSPKNDRAPGGTCLEGCSNLAAGIEWRKAGVTSSKGCGSAMRVAPIGLYYEDLEQIADLAGCSSLLTHGHDAAIAGASAAALLVALAARALSPEAMYEEVDQRCSAQSEDFGRVWHRLRELVDQPPERVLVEGALGEGWVAEEAVASAMYCVWRFPDDFRRAVLTAVNTDGDSDSIGTITGSILGARLGLTAIPAHWRDNVEDSVRLHELGKRLWEARWTPA